MKKNILHKKWFTLIELMVVMTIMIILTVAAYTPFAYYQTKQKVTNSAKIITQTLYNARSNAIYWVLNSNMTWNLDVWVLVENNSDKLKIYWFPFKENIVNYISPDNKYLIEEINLEPWVEITSSWWLFLYKAITWSWVYKNFTINSNKIELSVWFKWATSWTLTKKIEYYTNTYISDVK